MIDDKRVNLADIDPFINCLANCAYNAHADINCDGTNNLLDVPAFVDLLIGE